MPPPRIAPKRFIRAIVEIEVFEVLELGARRREQLLAGADMAIHRAADVEEEQHLGRIVPLRHHLYIEPAGVSRRRPNRIVEIELVGGALARELAQPP